MVHFTNKKGFSWTPNETISDAFFNDAIKWQSSSERYLSIIYEMKDALKFALYLLDYENSDSEKKKLLLEFTQDFLRNFNRIRPDYKNNSFVNTTYRNSIKELIYIIKKNI